jgi:hypothetical protein
VLCDGVVPSKISGVGTNFGLLVHVLPGPNKQREAKPRMRPAASFVLGIHFANSYFHYSRCPFGQIDNRKDMLGRSRSNFQKMCSHMDFMKNQGQSIAVN